MISIILTELQNGGVKVNIEQDKPTEQELEMSFLMMEPMLEANGVNTEKILTGTSDDRREEARKFNANIKRQGFQVLDGGVNDN
jgi:hypothetical protein